MVDLLVGLSVVLMAEKTVARWVSRPDGNLAESWVVCWVENWAVCLALTKVGHSAESLVVCWVVPTAENWVV